MATVCHKIFGKMNCTGPLLGGVHFGRFGTQVEYMEGILLRGNDGILGGHTDVDCKEMDKEKAFYRKRWGLHEQFSHKGRQCLPSLPPDKVHMALSGMVGCIDAFHILGADYTNGYTLDALGPELVQKGLGNNEPHKHVSCTSFSSCRPFDKGNHKVHQVPSRNT
mmetsp:Transcript_19563/g.30645  ORF Transcript_19563/g.30645 Transcript_19563/m.30645 type:complete len:165 (+) Transcript_19563:866-1360(+)